MTENVEIENILYIDKFKFGGLIIPTDITKVIETK